MIYHVLPGDAQVEAFNASGIDGEVLICREALVDGDVSGDSLDEFFLNRAAFHNQNSDEDPAVYNASVASQFRKLTELNGGDEVNLWFEYELFCAVNMWFCLSLLSRSDAAVYRVEPVYRRGEDRWDGFGHATADDMVRCFESRIKMTREDIALGSALWDAFRTGDNAELLRLGHDVSPAFPYLNEVCEAATEKESLPANIIGQIQADGISNFNEVFLEFRRRAGVFGFGDVQVKRVMEAMS